MLSYNIEGKFLNLVKNMYNHIKSCVLVNNTYSNFFLSHSVVRQGENLSPLLFSIFINDLESFLDNEGCKGVEISGFSENNVVFVYETIHTFICR